MHMSQIIRLCELLPRHPGESNFEPHTYESSISDTNSHDGAMDGGFLVPEVDALVTNSNTFQCPACQHAPFKRKQEQVRHFARHYPVKITCDGCYTLFSLSSKYIWHRCDQHAGNHQKAYHERWLSLRDDVRKALDQTCERLRRSKGLRETSAERWKRRKIVHAHGELNATVANTPPAVQEHLQSPPNLENSSSTHMLQSSWMPSQLLAGSPSQSSCAAADQQLAQAPDASAIWSLSSSDAPVVWDNWNWSGEGSWTPNYNQPA